MANLNLETVDKPKKLDSDDDYHITDVVKYCHDLFADNGQDNSKVTVDVATCYASSLPIYKHIHGVPKPDNVVMLGTDPQGNMYYAMCMTYIILREHVLGNLNGNYAAMISYVPMVLTQGRGLFIEPGNAWPLYTVGMISKHKFEDVVDVPDISQMSTIYAINQVLVSVAGQSHKMIIQERFLLGFNILQMLSKSIKGNQISLHPPHLDLEQCGKFDVCSNWKKLILIMIFDEDAPGLTNDLEELFDFIESWLEDFYDYTYAWGDDIIRNVLITTIVRIYGDEMQAPYEYYIDLMYGILDDVEDVFMPPGIKSRLLSMRPELENAEERGFLDPIELDLIHHNAGDFWIDDCTKNPAFVAGVRVKGGLQPMIIPSLDKTFSVKYRGVREILSVEGGVLTCGWNEPRKLLSLFHDQMSTCSGIFEGQKTENLTLGTSMQGSIVANIALSGALGPAPGLWVLSHIIHGDLTVSESSPRSYATLLAVPKGQLEIKAPLSSGIIRSIHAVTDGSRLFSVWTQNLMLELSRNGQALLSSGLKCSLEKECMTSCSILSNRPIL